MDWSKEETMRLIRSIKLNEVLWNTQSKNYKVVKEKELAWKSVEKEVGYPINECKRKVESLLAACRREKVKIKKSESTDPQELAYQPKWIFWKAMSFIRGEPEGDDLDELANNDVQWATSSRRPIRKRRKAKQNNLEKKNVETKEIDQSDKIDENPSIKTYHWEGDEYDAYGIIVAAKLRKMDENQRLFAENIINQTLYKGMLGQLSDTIEFVQSSGQKTVTGVVQCQYPTNYQNVGGQILQ